MVPLPFVWPYALVFWVIFIWSSWGESKLVDKAKKSAKRPGSLDAGSCQAVIIGMGLATVASFPLAWIQAFRVPAAANFPMFAVGIAVWLSGVYLRRHCWRMLGASFTGDVQVSSDQTVITSGAYTYLRHPSYTGGILINAGIGLALGSWASLILIVVVAIGVYSYRIAVEERVLLAGLGEPYAEFMKTRKRLIPFLY
jgi:protein-S-isoprenylcysteine O-methyltransferase Ste14